MVFAKVGLSERSLNKFGFSYLERTNLFVKRTDYVMERSDN